MSYHPHPIELPADVAVPTGTPDRFGEVEVLSDLMVEARDGVRLATDVYLPVGRRGPVAAILTRLPYGKTVDFMAMADHGAYWAKKGYAFVCQDVRGRFGSDGVFDRPLGRHEIADGFDTVDWIARQPWSNGRVGMWGESYYGFTALCGAISGHPALKAICPADPAGLDLHGLFWRQGCFPLNAMGAWALSMEDKGYLPFDHLDDWILPLESIPGPMAAKGELFRAWLGHPDRGGFWDYGDLTDGYDRIAVPMLLWGGWYDNIQGPWMADLLAIRERSPHPETKHLMVGPWDHESTPNATGRVGIMEVGRHGTHRADTVQAFFDHYLGGMDNGFDRRPATTEIFVMGENVWRFEESWPPARTEPTDWYLHGGGTANTRGGDGRLDRTAPDDEPADRFDYDPSDPVIDGLGTEPWAAAAEMGDRGAIEDRADVLCYTSAPLEADLEITGHVTMTLHAATSAADTDFAVALVDVLPDGRAHEIQHGIVRLSRRDGGARQDIEPGRVYPLAIDLWWTSHVVKAGHRLRVEVTSSRFNEFDRNLNSGEPPLTGRNPVVAHQSVHHDRVHPSAIRLPVIPR